MSRAHWILGLAGAGVAAGVVAWGLGAFEPEAVELEVRPNVLIIVWDTVRADRMSVYGHDKPTTPRMEAFAKEAVVYDKAWSPGIWTLSAHASMFTGKPVESTGADERWLWLDHGHTTLAEHLRTHGYDTFSFAANTLLSGDTNLVQGFRVVLNTWKGKVRELAQAATHEKLLAEDRSNELSPHWRPPDHGATNAEWARAEFKEAGPLIGEGFLKWVDQRPTADQPFFAYLNLMEAHTPRIPSREAREAVIGDPQRIELGLQTDAAHINLHFYNFGKHEYTEAELDAINGVYDATLWDLDQATSDLFAGLEARGILDDTIVILTADHGENLGDHHLFNHRFALWESLLHVPLIIRYPRGLKPGRSPTPVSTASIMGTVCDLAGLPLPSDPAVQSPSLRESVLPAPVAFMSLPLEREVRSVQQIYADVEVAPWLRSGHAVHEEGHKWVEWSNGRTELYDLRSDSAELHDLSDNQTAESASGRQSLENWRKNRVMYDPESRGPKDQPRAVRASQADLRNQLKALGYIAD